MLKPTTAKIGVTIAGAILAVSSASAETTLNAVSALTKTNVLTQSFLNTFMPLVNDACKGTVQIKYVGGQEVVPPRKAANALKRGQFDVLVSPTAYYIGTVPEGYAILAANQGPAELRKNGAFGILQEAYQKKADRTCWRGART